MKNVTKKKTGEKTRSLTPPKNYLAYNNLSGDGLNIFKAAKLHYYLQYAEDNFFPSQNKNWHIDLSSDRLIYNEAALSFINARVAYALGLIGLHCNERFGATPQDQHKFFQRIHEQGCFFSYLYAAVQKKKAEEVKNKFPQSTKVEHPYVGNTYLELEKQRCKTNCFYIGKEQIKEKDIYIAAIFYVINFMFDAVLKNDAARLSQLNAELLYVGLGTSYHAVHGKKGGDKRVGPYRTNHNKAYAIFVENNIQEKFGSKNLAMAEELHRLLKMKKIDVKISTLEVKWIPEFIKRQDIDMQY